VRWPREARWRLAAVAPVGFLALGVAIVAVPGELPSASEFVRFSGTAPTVPVLLVAIAVGAFGEEAGWRGYALPRMQARLGPLPATLLLALLWAAWHAPLVFVLASHGDFSALTVPTFSSGSLRGRSC
jgi:membrane protease YdiL (CAAX protease family)